MLILVHALCQQVIGVHPNRKEWGTTSMSFRASKQTYTSVVDCSSHGVSFYILYYDAFSFVCVVHAQDLYC